MSKKRQATKSVNSRKMEFSPDKNPLLKTETIELKKWKVRSGIENPLVNIETGELAAASVIHTIQDKDPEDFVKVFAAGVAASYELNRTAQRVFTAIMMEYENTPMVGGYADTIYLAWFGEGLCGRDIGMSEKTFQRGFQTLLDKQFLSPKTPQQFWVNPTLFFKGNRALLVNEYRRVEATDKPKKIEAELMPKEP